MAYRLPGNRSAPNAWKTIRAALPSGLGAGGSCKDPTAREAADTLSDLQWLCGLPLCSPSADELLTSQTRGAPLSPTWSKMALWESPRQRLRAAAHLVPPPRLD